MKFQSKIDKAIGEFKDRLLEEFGDNLVSVVVFGSQIKKPRWDSDIDLLIVIKNLTSDWREMDNRFSGIEYDISVKYGVSISAVYYTPEDVEFSIRVRDRLFLGILLGYKVAYDKNAVFEENITKLKNELDKEHATYIPDRKVWYIPSMKLRA